MVQGTVYGIRTKEQDAIVAEHVKGEYVVDLGCGPEASWERIFVEFGARKILLIDKELNRELINENRVRAPYHMVPVLPIPYVACLFYPVNYRVSGLLHWLSNAKKIVYRGKNLDGWACGDEPTLHHFLTRELLVYSASPETNLIVLGGVLDAPRTELTEEELGWQDNWNFSRSITASE